MYQAFNDNIIIEKPLEKVTDSGIIVAEQDNGAVFEVVVIATTTETAKLHGKTIYAERRHMLELPKADGRRFASLSYKNILAVKE